MIVSKFLKKGKVLELSDLDFKSPGGGLTPDKLKKVLGKKILKDHEQEELILLDNLND